ncbi:SH3 domain-containing protein [uncultured Sphingomonas sp.]|uniref:SH3 domain-containing protein n=1 Tax=uncultured Sphingomonas sp. TaxID=158754 RepID=UPI0035CB7943
MLDPLTNAVRRDIADIRLAEHVFAPHYVAPMERRIAGPTPLSADDTGVAAPLVMLTRGERFDVLDLSGNTAWGIAVDKGLVGYVPIAAIEGIVP